MKIYRQFKIHNEKYDPRQNLKIFLSKDSEGLYFWGYFKYKDEWEYKENLRHREDKQGIVTPLKSSETENKFKTLTDAMAFKSHVETVGIWRFIE